MKAKRRYGHFSAGKLVGPDIRRPHRAAGLAAAGIKVLTPRQQGPALGSGKIREAGVDGRGSGGEPEIETALLYDLYEGEQIAAGRKSLTYEIAFRAADRTLTDPEVDAIVGRIESRLEGLDVHLRT